MIINIRHNSFFKAMLYILLFEIYLMMIDVAKRNSLRDNKCGGRCVRRWASQKSKKRIILQSIIESIGRAPLTYQTFQTPVLDIYDTCTNKS